MRVVIRSLVILPLVLTLGVLATPAHAATTYSVTGLFVENSAQQVGCTETICGTGSLRPFGTATDSDVFDACGPGCNVKTFSFADGTLITDETLLVNTLVCSNPAPNGNCGVLTGQSSNDIVGGTGAFAGATGALLNTFTLTPDSRTGAQSAIAHYTGTVTLP